MLIAMAIDPVRYPNRDAFASMVADPGYREVTKLRAQALTEAVLQPTVPWSAKLDITH
jgi:hypothetical protein